MASQEKVLFLTIVLNESDKRKRWKKGFTKEFEMPVNQDLTSFQAMIQSVSKINPNCKFLFVEQITEGLFELKIEDKTENALWIKFSSIDKNTGVQYLNEVDDEVIKTILRGLARNS